MNTTIVNYLSSSFLLTRTRLRIDCLMSRFCVHQIQRRSLPSSSNSSSNSPIFGANYTRRLIYYPDANSTAEEYSVTNEELIEKFDKLIDGADAIKNVEYHRNPLDDRQLFDIFLHHAYLVFKTESWYWSFEKNTTGIILQRSKTIECVRDMFKNMSRPHKTTKRREAPAKDDMNMTKLIAFIQSKNYVNQDYNIAGGNCKHCAKEIYSFIAKYD